MMKKLRLFLIAPLFAMSLGGSLLAVATPSSASAACADRVFGFPTWYRGLVDGSCNVEKPGSDLSPFIWQIVLNIIEAVMVLIAYVSAGFIIYGGFLYITSAGDPGRITNAKNSILNAVIGLIISMLSIGIVNLIVDNI